MLTLGSQITTTYPAMSGIQREYMYIKKVYYMYLYVFVVILDNFIQFGRVREGLPHAIHGVHGYNHFQTFNSHSGRL